MASRSRVFFDIDSLVSSGRVIVELFDDKTPKASANFRALCTGERGTSPSGTRLCFQGIPFHRIVAPEFLVQGGDIVNSDGTSGESIYGEHFEDEDLGGTALDGPGFVGMANSGPNTNNSQFFITLCAAPWLEQTCTVFGRVVRGLEVIQKLEDIVVDSNDRPLEGQEVLITRSGRLQRKGEATDPTGAQTVNEPVNSEGDATHTPQGSDDHKPDQIDKSERHSEARSRSPRHRRHEHRDRHDDKHRDEHRHRDDRRHRDDHIHRDDHRHRHRDDENRSSRSSRDDRRESYDRHRSSGETRDSSDSRSRYSDRYDRYDRDRGSHRERESGISRNRESRGRESNTPGPSGEPEIVLKGRGAMKYRDRDIDYRRMR